MSEIINILSEKKFYNSKQLNLTVPLTLDSGQQLKVEDTLFQNLSLSDIGYNEKTTSNQYFVYGKLTPIVNLSFKDKKANEPNIATFNFRDETNWNLLLLRPSSNEITVLPFDNGNKIDFTNGLPLIPITSIQIDGIYRIGFRSVFNHDFSIGDYIDIVDNSGYISSGKYAIVAVYGNAFYINKTLAPISGTTITAPSLSSVKQVQSFDTTNLTAAPTVTDGTNTFNVIDESADIDLSNILYKTFAKKIDNGLQRRYYIKTLRVIDNGVCNDFDLLAFSKTQFGGDAFEFAFDKPFNINYVDNLGYPIDKIYLGLVKSAITPNTQISSVVAKFSTQMHASGDTQTLQVISEKDYVSNKIKISGNSDILYFGLVSYNYDQLIETMINPVEHSFKINPGSSEITFAYSPFKEIRIRQKSAYIETSEKALESPSYAYYDTNKEEYRWRDTLNTGIIDASGNGIDLPFMNGSHYAYVDFIFNLKNFDTPKYTTNYNYNALNYNFLSDLYKTNIFDISQDGLDSDNEYLKPTDDAC